MQSTSADDGTYTLAVTFAIGTDPDKAQVLVQNRVAIALSSLPQEVQIQGVTTKKQSTSILEFVGLVSPDSRSTACSCRTTPSSTCRTNFAASTAWAT